MILIVVETLDAELIMKESPTAVKKNTDTADRLRRRRRRKARKAGSRIKAAAVIANVTMMIVQAVAMKIRPRRQIQMAATPIMLILLDSSTAHRVSARDIVHHRKIDRVHLLVVQYKETNAQQNQLERVLVSYILPVIHRLLRSPWQTRCFIHQG